MRLGVVSEHVQCCPARLSPEVPGPCFGSASLFVLLLVATGLQADAAGLGCWAPSFTRLPAAGWGLDVFLPFFPLLDCAIPLLQEAESHSLGMSDNVGSGRILYLGGWAKEFPNLRMGIVGLMTLLSNRTGLTPLSHGRGRLVVHWRALSWRLMSSY